MGFILDGTGTLYEGGNLDPLAQRLFVCHLQKFKQRGFDVRKNPKAFLDEYGKYRKVKKCREWQKQDGTMTEWQSEWKVDACPGFTPELINYFLDSTAVVKMMDLAANMPPYSEIIAEIEPGLLLSPYQQVEKRFYEVMDDLKEQEKDVEPEDKTSLMSTFLQAMLTYLERIDTGFDVFKPWTKEWLLRCWSLAELGLRRDELTPKEEYLVELVQAEHGQGRKCFVLYESSGETDIAPRLQWVMDQAGIQAAKLEKDTTQNRAAIIEKLLKAGSQVIQTNPRKIKTGLDLLETPTIIFYQQPLSALTMRQASRRAWRVIQTQPCKTYYLVYAETWQYDQMSLMKQKLASALALEGELSESGLAAMGDDDTTSIAKELTRMMRKPELRQKIDLKSAWADMREQEVRQSMSGLTAANVKMWEAAMIPLTQPFHFKSLSKEPLKKKVQSPLNLLAQSPQHEIIQDRKQVVGNVLFDVTSYVTKKGGRKVRTTTRMTVQQLESASGVVAQARFDF